MTSSESARPGSDARRDPPRDTAGSWFANAAAAASIAAGRAETWLPGALASLAFLGWLPFLLSVTALPSLGDLGFWAASLAVSPSYPANVVLLAGAAALTVVAASVLVASGEAALLRAVAFARGGDIGRLSFDEEAARLWLVQLVAALPALVAAGAAIAAIAAVAPGEYQSPDLGQPFLVRLARDVWPYLAALLVLALAGQAYGASAQRAAVGTRAMPLGRALADGARELIRHPVRRIGLAIASSAALAAFLAATWALLRLLWQPIAQAAGDGQLITSGGVLLLVAFVAIWLCLVLGAGALHAWASAWWSLEVEDGTIDAKDGRWT